MESKNVDILVLWTKPFSMLEWASFNWKFRKVLAVLPKRKRQKNLAVLRPILPDDDCKKWRVFMRKNRPRRKSERTH